MFSPLHTIPLISQIIQNKVINHFMVVYILILQLLNLTPSSSNNFKTMNYPRRRAAGYQKEIINRPKGRGINPLSASGGLNHLLLSST